MIRKNIIFNYVNGCQIIVQPNNTLHLKINGEKFLLSEDNKAVFPGNTGETVIEYSGLTTDIASTRSFAKASFIPRGSSPAHYHNHIKEDYYVFSGKAAVIIGGFRHLISAGQHIQILPGETHQVVNPSVEKPLHLLVICTPAWHPNDFNLIII